MTARKHPHLTLLSAALLAIAVLGLTAGTQAQTPTDIYTFGSVTGDATNPIYPSYLAQGRDGNMYGTAPIGGATNQGAVFLVTPSGTETVLHSFKGTDGNDCLSGLSLGYDGNFYGACSGGGTSNQGVVYKITPTGTFTLVHSFSGEPDGASPDSPPIQGTDGNFYGTTQSGGNNNDGTVYKITPSGTLTVLHSFIFSTDGADPEAALVQGSDGNLYGSTASSARDGELFKVSTAGKLKVLHTFIGSDGDAPTSAMIQGADGNFYGVTQGGGVNGQGVAFKMSAAGKLTVLHSFASVAEGGVPQVSPMQATDGNLYGALDGGGSSGDGGLYKLTTAGTFSTLFFFSGSNGNTPGSALAQNTNGLLYGDTDGGGSTNKGVFFSLNTGAAPFCSLQITSGKIGASTNILGQGFGASSTVSFGGVQASSIALTGTTFIIATLPPAALTGSVTVKTGSTTLTCKQMFKVTPTLKAFSPANGPVGTSVTITGTGLKQTSKVTFNKTVASFTVNSDTQVTASVPAGATTGKIVVTTKGGTVASATTFTVN